MKNHREIFQSLVNGETLINDEGIELFIKENGYINRYDYFQINESEKFYIKPKTININGFDVPDPIRIKPEEGQQVWHGFSTVMFNYNDNNYFIKEWLDNGLLHDNLEAAHLHRKALLSFTKID